MSKIKAMMNQLAASVTAQAETVATLSTNIKRDSISSRKIIDKKQVRPVFRVCAHCKRKVCHKDRNCLELEVNKAKRYPGWKSVFTKE